MDFKHCRLGRDKKEEAEILREQDNLEDWIVIREQ